MYHGLPLLSQILCIRLGGFALAHVLFTCVKPFISIVIIIYFYIFFFLEYLPSNVFYFQFCYPFIFPYHPWQATEMLFCYFCAMLFLPDTMHSSRLILISSSLDDLNENPSKLVISILFPNKSSHSSSPKTVTLFHCLGSYSKGSYL